LEELMNDLSTTLDAYLAMWNERDLASRATLIETAWSADCRYVDPQFEAEGHAGLSTMVTAAQIRFPGHDLRLASGIDTHHDEVRLAWEVVAPDGSSALKGIDIGSLGPDGRLTSVVGFFGELPARECGNGSFAESESTPPEASSAARPEGSRR
jgi:SnoaL-like domain